MQVMAAAHDSMHHYNALWTCSKDLASSDSEFVSGSCANTPHNGICAWLSNGEECRSRCWMGEWDVPECRPLPAVLSIFGPVSAENSEENQEDVNGRKIGVTGIANSLTGEVQPSEDMQLASSSTSHLAPPMESENFEASESVPSYNAEESHARQDNGPTPSNTGTATDLSTLGQQEQNADLSLVQAFGKFIVADDDINGEDGLIEIEGIVVGGAPAKDDGVPELDKDDDIQASVDLPPMNVNNGQLAIEYDAPTAVQQISSMADLASVAVVSSHDNVLLAEVQADLSLAEVYVARLRALVPGSSRTQNGKKPDISSKVGSASTKIQASNTASLDLADKPQLTTGDQTGSEDGHMDDNAEQEVPSFLGDGQEAASGASWGKNEAGVVVVVKGSTTKSKKGSKRRGAKVPSAASASAVSSASSPLSKKSLILTAESWNMNESAQEEKAKSDLLAKAMVGASMGGEPVGITNLESYASPSSRFLRSYDTSKR